MTATLMPVRPPVVLGRCTRDTTRCADARDYDADLRPCCRGHLRQIVADVGPVLDELGIPWWADYGTLLGAVRNPLLGLPAGIIPHDKDADFGMLWPGHPALHAITARLEATGYSVSIRRDGDNLKVRLSGLNWTNADFFTWHERADGTLYRRHYLMGVDRYKGRDFPRDTAFPLETVQWEGLTLPAPRNPAAFCAFRYGPDWRTPIRANHDGIPRGVSQ